MSSGELALALVSSSQRARTSKDAEGADFGGDDAVAQPARTADSRSETIHLIGQVVAERRGSIVCSLRLFVAMPELGALGPAKPLKMFNGSLIRRRPIFCPQTAIDEDTSLSLQSPGVDWCDFSRQRVRHLSIQITNAQA